MSFAGWGGFNGRVDGRAANSRTVARWSGNTSTAGTTPNRAGGAVPSMLQSTPADQPLITTLTNGVQALTFDGTSTDLTLAPSAAVALLSPRLYWAFHIRLPEASPALRTVWSEWGSTERFQIASNSTSVIVTVALSAVASASATFPLSVAAKQAGVFLEVFFDGNAAAAKRIRLFVGLLEVTASGTSGTPPTSLLLGNAVSNWLGSLNGSANRAMSVAHFWYLQGHPTPGERAAMAADEAPNWEFHPTQVPSVAAWLQVASATLASGDVSSLPDTLNVNPAVQTVAGVRPTAATSDNGRAIMNFATNDGLEWPMIAANNDANSIGFAFWIKPVTAAALCNIFYIHHVSTSYKIALNQVGAGGLEFYVFFSPTAARYGTVSGVLAPGRWNFVTIEYNALQATNSLAHVITVDAVVKSLGFSNIGGGGAGPLPISLGPGLLGPTAPGAFALGPHIYSFNSKMPSAAQGLLTPEARLDLMNYQRPMDTPDILGVANGGPISAWLRVTAATVTGLGVSSLTDSFNSNPAVQTTDARRPPKATAANGLPIMTFGGDDVLVWPLITAINSLTSIGFGFWFKPVTIAAGLEMLIARMAFAGSGGLTQHQGQFMRSGSALVFECYFSNAAASVVTVASALTAGAWHFITGEYDSFAPTQSERHALTVNAIVPASTFAGSAAAGDSIMPASGNSFIGAQTNGVAAPAVPMLSGSSLGPNIYVFNSKMAGATEGQLTAAARIALMNYQAPT